jgi:1,6-anhydro-N-acetylmuramate kinase
MLLREMAARLPDVASTPVGELGIPGGALEPACVAIMALCHLDQTPGNPTAVTGTEIPRVLGRLTPGSPQNWQRLLHQMSGTGVATAPRPLRSAL